MFQSPLKPNRGTPFADNNRRLQLDVVGAGTEVLGADLAVFSPWKNLNRCDRELQQYQQLVVKCSMLVRPG
jgi:hypothetical protein